VGFVAVAWALLTAHDDPLRSMAGHVPSWLILTLAVLSVVVLILDMFQYVAITSMADAAYRICRFSLRRRPVAPPATTNLQINTHPSSSRGTAATANQA
jgi:hypothetical protein